MPFPWGQSTLPATFKCPYCKDVKTIFRDTVAVCDCPGSEQKAAEDRERVASHQHSQKEAQEARMKAANDRRRRGDG
jgi:glutaredoxin